MQAAARQLYSLYGTIPTAIKSSYPNITFDDNKFAKAKRVFLY